MIRVKECFFLDYTSLWMFNLINRVINILDHKMVLKTTDVPHYTLQGHQLISISIIHFWNFNAV
uniref:Uncharacterized protein n=1 Tax=Rhizophora mucronata TaxID=61149 RepID=A0A2P2LPQ7_RHIMU